MIQRIQSVWLLVAAILCSGVFYFDLYQAHSLINNVDTVVRLRVNDHFPSLILSIILVLLPTIAIFMFKNRQQQRRMVYLAIIDVIGFTTVMIMRVTDFANKSTGLNGGSYSIASVLPLFSLIFLILALRGIRKDEKLIKSLDRLR